MEQYVGLSPFPVIVTTRIVSCFVGNPCKPSFATITGKGDNPNDMEFHVFDFMGFGHNTCQSRDESVL